MKRDSVVVAREQEIYDSEEIFEHSIRGIIREAVMDLMSQEVESLCGRKYESREGKEYVRGGSEKGHISIENQREEMTRPRVRQHLGNGKTQEVGLKSFHVAKSRRSWKSKMFDLVSGGMSQRSVEKLDWQDVSDTTVQRHFSKVAAQKFVEFRERDLGLIPFFAMSVDGVHFSKGLTGIIAIGFCMDGSKKVLDFEIGSSENAEVCKTLLRRIKKRGFRCGTEKLLVMKDDSDALGKAIPEVFPESLIQLCWIHKERNLHAYLSKKHWHECSGLVAKIRNVQGTEAGEEAFDNLHRFIQSKNAQCALALLENKDKLLTVHRLETPSTLHSTLLSTNCIENVIHNVRKKTNRVCHWENEEALSRWMAFSLLDAEKGFRKIRGLKDLPLLIEKLGRSPAVASDYVPAEATLRVVHSLHSIGSEDPLKKD